MRFAVCSTRYSAGIVSIITRKVARGIARVYLMVNIKTMDTKVPTEPDAQMRSLLSYLAAQLRLRPRCLSHLYMEYMVLLSHEGARHAQPAATC